MRIKFIRHFKPFTPGTIVTVENRAGQFFLARHLAIKLSDRPEKEEPVKEEVVEPVKEEVVEKKEVLPPMQEEKQVKTLKTRKKSKK